MPDVRLAADQLLDLTYQGEARVDQVSALLELLGGPREATAVSVDSEDMINAVRDSSCVATTHLLDAIGAVAQDATAPIGRRRVAAHILVRACLWGAAAHLLAQAGARSRRVAPLDAIRRYPRHVVLADIGVLRMISGGPSESLAIAARARLAQLRAEGAID